MLGIFLIKKKSHMIMSITWDHVKNEEILSMKKRNDMHYI